jgi:hypothetical protein
MGKKKDKAAKISEPAEAELGGKITQKNSPGCRLSLPTFRLG